MKLLVTTFLFLIIFTLQNTSKIPTLSLYHTSGTTFLNLRKKSNIFSVWGKLKNYKPKAQVDVSVGATTEENKATNHSTNSFEIDGLENPQYGNTIIFPQTDKATKTTKFRTPFLNPPNGEHEKQGWILKEEDYYSEKDLHGDLPHLQNWFKNNLGKFELVELTVNVEVNELKDVLNTAFNVLRTVNRKLMVKDIYAEKRYPGSKGFLQKLLARNIHGNPSYSPSLETLFEDYMIRQTLEINKLHGSPWKVPITKAREILLKVKKLVLPLRAIELAPYLIHHFPNDEVSKKFIQDVYDNNGEDIVKRPFIQFSEFDKSCGVDLAVKRAVGLVKITELYGPIVADKALAEISYLEERVLDDIRAKLKEKKVFLIKYIVMDPVSCPMINNKDYRRLERTYKKQGVILTYIGTNIYGISPLIVPGESVIWHQRTEHRFNILGKYNVALINYNLAHAFENKYLETLFWERYCPGFLPRSRLLSQLISKDTDPYNVSVEEFVNVLTKEFPNGFVAKGVWDYNGDGAVIHHKIPIVNRVYSYRNSTFRGYVEEVSKTLLGCEPVEDLYDQIKPDKHFLAWKIERLLNNSYEAIIQEFQPIFREYRVECAGGVCPLDQMNIDEDRCGKDSKKFIMETKKFINGEFMKCLNTLPENLRGMPLTSDAAQLKDRKKISVFETNPGGNSWLLHNSFLLKYHNSFLLNYPKIYEQNKKIYEGMTPENQMKYIIEMIKEWGVDLNLESKRFEFLRDRITDVEHVVPYNIKISNMNSLSNYPKVRVAKYVLTKKLVSYAIANGIRYIGKSINTGDTFLEILGKLTRFSELCFDGESIVSDIKKKIEKKFIDSLEDKVSDLLYRFRSLINGKNKKSLVRRYKKFVKLNFNLLLLNDQSSDSNDSTETNIVNTNKLNEAIVVYTNEFNDWKVSRKEFSALFFGFDIFDTKLLEDFSLDVKYIKKWSRRFKSSLETLYYLKRLDIKLQDGFELENILSLWIPKIRDILKVFLRTELKGYGGVVRYYAEVLVSIFEVFTDSMFLLKSENYQDELKFLDEYINSSPELNSFERAQIFSTYAHFDIPQNKRDSIRLEFLKSQDDYGSWGKTIDETYYSLKVLVNFEQFLNTTMMPQEIFLKKLSSFAKPPTFGDTHLTVSIPEENFKFVSQGAVTLGLKFLEDHFLTIFDGKVDDNVLHYVHAVTNIRYMVNSFTKEQRDTVLRIIEKIKVNQNLFLVPIREKLKKYKILYDQGSILSMKELPEFGKVLVEAFEDLIDLRNLNLSGELTETLKDLNELFINHINHYRLDKVEVGKLLYKGFDIYDTSKKFDNIIKDLKNGKGLKEFQAFHAVFFDVIGSLHAAHRLDFQIPYFDFGKFFKKWFTKIRKIYPLIQSNHKIRNDKLFKPAYIDLMYLITHLYYSINDYSLYKMNLEVYRPEYDALKKALYDSIYLIKNNDLIGELVDCLRLFKGEPDNFTKELILRAQVFIVNKQENEGGFPDEGRDNDIHATHTAITALASKDYAEIDVSLLNELGKTLSSEKYQERLKSLGLLQ